MLHQFRWLVSALVLASVLVLPASCSEGETCEARLERVSREAEQIWAECVATTTTTTFHGIGSIYGEVGACGAESFAALHARSRATGLKWGICFDERNPIPGI